MSEYQTAGAAGVSRLFEGNIPNLVKEAVLSSVQSNSNISDEVFFLQIKGYN